MNLDQNNPHRKILEESIIQSFLGPYPQKGLFAPLIGDEEFDYLYNNFLHLTDEEKIELINRIIKAYFANQVYSTLISKMMPNSSSGHGRTSTR
jgi:hypothetical protein